MRSIARVILYFFVVAPIISAQLMGPGLGISNGTGSPGSTPAFVGEFSDNSTLTNQVGALASGTTAATCQVNTYCIPYADSTLTGNLGVIFYQYSAASQVSVTAIDVVANTASAPTAVNTYTCGGTTQQKNITPTTFYVGFCYAPNMTAGAHVVEFTFASAVTQVFAKTQQFRNIATSTPIDGTVGLASGASSTTVNAASVTPSVANDLIDVFIARIATPNTSSVTAGSGYTLGTIDLLDGGSTEFEVDSGTGSLTPTMTMGTASTYGEIAIAFKSASAGTAPTGMYLERGMSWSYTTATVGSRSFQFPSSGNLLVNTDSCNTLSPTSISGDITNSWTAIPGGFFNGTGNLTGGFYVPNASSDNSGALTVNAASVSGDCTFKFYSFAGAPTTVFVSRSDFEDLASAWQTSSTFVWPATNKNNTAAAQVSPFIPNPTSGVAIAFGGQIFNTTVGISGPSNCFFDAATQGGENISGPWPVDQNNPFAHCYFNGSPNVVWGWPQTSTLNASGDSGTIVGFFGSTGAAIVNGSTMNQSTSGTDLTFTVTAPTSGNLLAVVVGAYNGITVKNVCIGGDSTCGTGTQFTAVPGATSTGSGHPATSVWYVLNAPAGSPTRIDVVTSAACSNCEATYYEVKKGSGSWSTDGGNQITNGTGSGTGLITGPAITTTGSIDFCTATAAVSGTMADSGSPPSGSQYQIAGTLYENTSDGVESLLTTTIGTHTPTWQESTLSDSFSSSQACFK